MVFLTMSIPPTDSSATMKQLSLLSKLEPTIQQPNPLPLTQQSSPFSKSELPSGEEVKPLVPESPQPKQQPQKKVMNPQKSLEMIEDEPFPDARIWRITASELEQWRQVLSLAKKSVHRNM